ncbi:hypothetical protein MKW98_012695 [Papaver atlanticum]|uniref:Cytochrome P450 n=1 Tax=Papaver atlanticum TaxID=357466 RepID=A0AAD4SVY7_9MAGN|nr:hypothetical protein MKW98_012695 [Papaver atlanticum]
MDGNSLFIIASTVVIVLAIAKFLALRKSYPTGTEWPAGPKTLPLIGNLHQLWGDLFHVVLANLAKVHGGVFTIWLGSWNPVIIVSDVNSAREVLLTRSSDYSARNYPGYLTVLSEGNDSINGSDCGPFWHNLRKGLTSGALNPLYVTSQSHLQERDMQNLIKSMQENASRENGVIKPLDYVKKEAIRLLNRTIFGQDFSNDEDFIVGIHHTVHHLISIGGFANLADAFKIGEYVPRHRRYIRGLYDVGEQAAKLILPHIASKPPTNSYLHFLKSQDFSEDVTVSLILEVFGFATDSIASTIVWALTFLVREQKIQEKLYCEIKEVTGGTRPVKIADLNKMSYLKAVVKETIRMKPLGPMAIAHKATKNTSLMGRKIDKGTPVMVNIYAIQHNSEVFPEPYKFIPERFLSDVNSDGSLGDREAMERSYLAFGAGMRICAGMDIAKLSISFGIASLVNEFKWDCVSDGKLPDVAEDLSLILLIKNPLEARITPRVDYSY